MSHVEQINLGRRLEHKIPVTQGVKTGRMIFISGQIALDGDGNVVGENDLAAQCRKCFENMKEVLEAAGATFSDVVKLTSFFSVDITDSNVVQTYFDIREEFLGRHRPSSSGVQVKALMYPTLMLEMDAIAVVAEGAT